ncbi:inositol phosphate phosphatase SopB [Endozoicomonas sp.]|uniref:inositol phosphate phosphatase SopB n=1 Tax=Endozoicomonas sp. TaxID=1892382 RepID=UPI003AF61BA6
MTPGVNPNRQKDTESIQQPVNNQAGNSGSRKATWRHRIIKKITKSIISPIKTALLKARYHPKGSVKNPAIDHPITSRDIHHLPESWQRLSDHTTPGANGNSNAALFSLESIYFDAALKIINDIKNAPDTGFGSKLISLEQEILFEKQQQHDTLNLKGEIAATNKAIKHAKQLSKSLKSRLKKAGVPESVVNSSYRKNVNQTLNKRSWNELDCTHQTNAGTLKHHQIPASKMQMPFQGEKPGAHNIFEIPYRDIEGICSQTSDSQQHAVNLWTSSFVSPQGKFNYQGVRHGIHSAFGITDPTLRQAANLKRAKESLVAALTLKPEQLREAISTPTKSVHINLASTSLVTPDPIRRGAKSEARMLQEQVDAFRELGAKQPLKLTVVDSDGEPVTIRVTFKMALFNFGVNKGAQGTFSGVVGGWKTSDKLNKEGLNTLIGSTDQHTVGGIVADYLAQQKQKMVTLNTQLTAPYLSRSQKQEIHEHLEVMYLKRKAILQLVAQIRNIFNNKEHHYEKHDAYKLPARISLLTSLIEGVPLSNCKSGKDRTGMLDAEIKLLATQIERYGEVPQPGQPIPQLDAELFRDILLNSGNLDIQKLNTGAEGYKTEGIESIDEHIGKAYLNNAVFNKYRSRVRGLSGAVKA